VAVLGPVELRSHGARLMPPSGKARDLLVRLALEAGRPVRAERLIEDLWPDDAHRVAPNTLQSKVSTVRRALADPGLVIGDRTGYRLAVAPGCVDAVEVLTLAASAASLRAAGDPEKAESTGNAALALFTGGEVLPDAGDAPWVRPYRARLEDIRLRLTEDHLAAMVDGGGAAEAVGELESLVGVHPLREELWTLLVTALYRAGRQADALAAYRTVQRHLHEELGLRPGPDLVALEHRVLSHDPALAAHPARPAAPRTPGRAVRPDAPGNIGAPPSVLVGREGDVRELQALLAHHRLVTVTGPAGVGKTRTAVEVARASGWSGGSWLIRLEEAHAAAAVWHAVGEALGVDAATESLVLDRLRGSGMLLVLDGCEHLGVVLPELVGRMLREAPDLRVLATSQAPLRVDGEEVYPLHPLDLDESVRLFCVRAAARRASFTLDGADTHVVETVCRSLDGLPLAIELAAARVTVLSVHEIARRLDDRFALLADPTSTAASRHRALRGAIAWSYDLLFPDDQRGLWALACFSDGAPLLAVEHVMASLGVPPDVALDVLGRLAERSLVAVEVAAGGDVRYRLLGSVRQYSRDRADEAAMLDVARGAHASWFADASGRAASGARGPDQVGAIRLVRAERANIDAALAWCGTHDPLLGLRIATACGWPWVVLGAGVHAAARLRAAEGAAREMASSRDRVDALLLAGLLEGFGGDVDRAASELESTGAMAADDQVVTFHLHLALVRLQQGRPREAVALLAGCRPYFHAHGDGWHEGLSHLLAASAHVALGDTPAGRSACEEALRLLTPLGDRWGVVHGEAMLGALAQAEHRYTEAAEHLARAADSAAALGFSGAAAYHLTSLGRAQMQLGDDRQARSTLERAIEAASAAGDGRVVATGRVHLSRLLRRLGELPEARSHAEAARSGYRSAGGGDGALLADHVLAAMALDDGAADAEHRLRDVLVRARGTDDAEVQVLAMDALGLLTARAGRRGDAWELVEAADRLLPAGEHLIAPTDREDRARAGELLGLGDAGGR
jgi:predicted ATPase/DNA-binding SARP family transcriptional activator